MSLHAFRNCSHRAFIITHVRGNARFSRAQFVLSHTINWWKSCHELQYPISTFIATIRLVISNINEQIHGQFFDIEYYGYSSSQTLKASSLFYSHYLSNEKISFYYTCKGRKCVGAKPAKKW